ncbi:hypothetical protein [Glycomyces sp. NPDC048151]|uniref:hypothetical protein n=1 Tax=Glycomyces sp. NPDC048151 TaxID=3364002 RepID=UPI003715F687
MELAAKVALVRPRMGELVRYGWDYELGEPADAAGLPPALAELYRVFDGLATRMGFVDIFDAEGALAELEKKGEGDLHDPVPGLVQFGTVGYGDAVCVDTTTGAVHLLNADLHINAVKAGGPLETKVLAPSPVEFADEYLFGPRYRELIDLVGGYPLPEDEEEDEWRLLLDDLGLS